VSTANYRSFKTQVHKTDGIDNIGGAAPASN
jgi:hypothetical protein